MLLFTWRLLLVNWNATTSSKPCQKIDNFSITIKGSVSWHSLEESSAFQILENPLKEAIITCHK